MNPPDHERRSPPGATTTVSTVDYSRPEMVPLYGGFAEAPPPVITSTFWDQQKIAKTMTPQFLKRALPEPLRSKLKERLQYGEGLTECTYEEWIQERTRKLFLLLNDIGCAEKIFQFIDESWEDADLPVTMESLELMKLGVSFEKKFLKKQHMFLVRELEVGRHVDYSDDEIVPLGVVYNRFHAGRHPLVEKVYFPRFKHVYYSRRRVPIGDDVPGRLPAEIFLEEVHRMQRLTHEHIVEVHATYTQHDFGFIVLTPILDLNLKAFLQSQTPHFKFFSKEKRKHILLDWIHCLSDALAFLHEEGQAHGDLKPSSIIVETYSCQIYLADIGNTKSLEPHIKPPQLDLESYDYGAPEEWIRSPSPMPPRPPTSSGVTISSRLRRRRALPPPRPPSSSSSTASSSTPAASEHHLQPPSLSWRSVTSVLGPGSADVYSMGCVFLDILTLYSKRKPSAFVSHRTSKPHRPRETAPPDASFHENPEHVESWIDQLLKQAIKLYDGTLPNALELVRGMVSRDPGSRPRMRAVEETAYRIVMSVTPEGEMPHCGMHTVVNPNLALLGGGWDGRGSEATRSVGSGTTASSSDKSSVKSRTNATGFAAESGGFLLSFC